MQKFGDFLGLCWRVRLVPALDPRLLPSVSNMPLAAQFNHEGYSQQSGWFQAIERSILCGPLPAFVHCATNGIFAGRGVTGPPRAS